MVLKCHLGPQLFENDLLSKGHWKNKGNKYEYYKVRGLKCESVEEYFI